MRLINFKTATKATVVLVSMVGLCGIAAADSSSTASISNSQPTNVPGLAAGLISMPALNTQDIISGTVGSIAGGGVLAGGVRRFALPGQGNTGAAGAAGGNLWNAWVAYSRSNIGYEFAPLSSSGKVDVYVGGVDYTLANNTVFGVAFAHDRTDVDLNFSGGKLTGRGNTISPYFGIALDRQWALDATIGFGRADVDTAVGGVTGSTNVDRTVGSLGLTFRSAVDKWQLTGRGAYLAVRDKLGAYTLTNGIFVPDGTVNVSQLRLSGQIAYDAGNIVPYFGLTYINDLRRPDQAPIGGVSAANDDDAWTPTIGLRFKTDGSVYGSIQYSTERNRSEVKNNQFLFNIGVRF